MVKSIHEIKVIDVSGDGIKYRAAKRTVERAREHLLRKTIDRAADLDLKAAQEWGVFANLCEI